LRAGVSLADQTVEKEFLDQLGKEALGCALHRGSPDEKREKRFEAMPISSGMAERYQ